MDSAEFHSLVVMRIGRSAATVLTLAWVLFRRIPGKALELDAILYQGFHGQLAQAEPLRVGQSYHHEVGDMPETSPAGEVRNPSTLIDGAVVWITTVPLAPITLEKVGAAFSVIASC